MTSGLWEEEVADLTDTPGLGLAIARAYSGEEPRFLSPPGRLPRRSRQLSAQITNVIESADPDLRSSLRTSTP